MKKIRYFLFIIFFAVPVCLQAQFIVDTLNTVEIMGTKVRKSANFSTFSSGLSLKSLKNSYIINKESPGTRSFIYPIAIRVDNTKGVVVRLDSMFIKSAAIDTSKISFTLNVFAGSKLYDSSPMRFVARKDKVSTLMLDSILYLPAGLSYISFSFSTKGNYRFSIYNNRKIEGHLYSYNKEKDEFRLLEHENGMPGLFCPQIKLYYTKK